MVLEQRLQADASALDTFVALNRAHVNLAYRSADRRRHHLVVNLDAPVAHGDGYLITNEHTVVVEIPDNYLARDAKGTFVKARIRREGERFYHPNVWPSDGYLCYDDKFVPIKTLAEQVWTALRLVQCELINHDSPADWDADYFFLQNGDRIRSQIRCVNLLLPKAPPQAAIAVLPRVA